MDMGVRDFHSEDSNAYPLAWEGRLDGLSHFLCEGAEACVCCIVKVEDIVFFRVSGNHKSVSLCHRSYIEECIEVIVLRHLV